MFWYLLFEIPIKNLTFREISTNVNNSSAYWISKLSLIVIVNDELVNLWIREDRRFNFQTGQAKFYVRNLWASLNTAFSENKTTLY